MEKAVRLSDYECAELKLGAGGQANVYRRFDARAGMSYAVKIMRTEGLDDQKREWQTREISVTLKKIIHVRTFLPGAVPKVTDQPAQPRLLRSVACHEFADGFALVMPFYELGSLHTQDASRIFSISQTREVIRQLLQGLGYLHDRGYQHRDIKPPNVLVETLNPLKIILADFGFVSESNPVSLCGTPGYWAPEIFNYYQQQENYTTAVDIYSLGMLLRWLLGLDPTKTPFSIAKEQHAQYVVSEIDAAIKRCPPGEKRDALTAARTMTQWEPDSRGSAKEWLDSLWLAPRHGLVSESNPVSLCGTPGYCAPEIFNYYQQQENYTTAVDIYSLGILLCWLHGLDPTKTPFSITKEQYTKYVISEINAAIDRCPPGEKRNALTVTRTII